MKIVFLDASTLGDDIDYSSLESLGDLTLYTSTNSDEIVERAKQAEVLIVNKVKLDKAVIDQLPQLKLICEAATGVDNIDVEYAKSKSIKVKNVKGYSTNSVAQHTFAMAMYFLNDLEVYRKFSASGEWTRQDNFSFFRPYQNIETLRWGIIGLGDIGNRVAGLATSFGAKVYYYSTSGLNNSKAYEQLSLDKLLKNSDIISIHAPLNDKTKNLIGVEELLKLKRNTILINVGRGGIINEVELAAFLQKDEFNIRVGLDVLEQEPMKPDHPLLDLKDSSKLLITPHMAWASAQSRASLLEGVFSNIKTYLEGQ